MKLIKFLIPLFIFIPNLSFADVTHFGDEVVNDCFPKQTILMDPLTDTTSFTVLGNDTTGFTTDLDHVWGDASLEFDKVDGAGDTVFAGIQKTITAVNLGDISLTDIISFAINVSATTDIAYAFVRLGTSASHYNEWRVADSNLAAGWNFENVRIGEASTAGNTGNGIDYSAITYIAIGVAFDGEANTLADIRVNNLSIQSTLLNVAQ